MEIKTFLPARLSVLSFKNIILINWWEVWMCSLNQVVFYYTGENIFHSICFKLFKDVIITALLSLTVINFLDQNLFSYLPSEYLSLSLKSADRVSSTISSVSFTTCMVYFEFLLDFKHHPFNSPNWILYLYDTVLTSLFYSLNPTPVVLKTNFTLLVMHFVLIY